MDTLKDGVFGRSDGTPSFRYPGVCKFKLHLGARARPGTKGILRLSAITGAPSSLHRQAGEVLPRGLGHPRMGAITRCMLDSMFAPLRLADGVGSV